MDWYDATKELPAEEGYYLVWDDNNINGRVREVQFDGVAFIKKFPGRNEIQRLTNVTHWMEMPWPPAWRKIYDN
jgi:hypothetical protein